MRSPTSTASASRLRSSDVGELSLALAQAGVGILSLTPALATLEDLFFRLTEARNGEPPPPAGMRAGEAKELVGQP